MPPGESQARYITGPAIAMDSLKIQPDGTLLLQTPPDPRTGQTSTVLDPLEWIHRITAHPRSPDNILDARMEPIATGRE